jgi:hypothetical protein
LDILTAQQVIEQADRIIPGLEQSTQLRGR